MAVVRTPGFCALCKSRCGSIMVTDNGKLIAQEPNPEHPTGVALCVKGRAAPEIVYRPERQLYPMVRTNPPTPVRFAKSIPLGWDAPARSSLRTKRIVSVRTSSGPFVHLVTNSRSNH